jgi:hypothetical protein
LGSVEQQSAGSHRLQRAIVRLAAPFWVPLAALYLRFYQGYRIEGRAGLRERFAQMRRESAAPLLVCPNHLTLIDSALVAWALVPVWKLAFLGNWLLWNVPERENFARGPWQRAATYLAKCIPISRGGKRDEVAAVLARVTELTRSGEVALLFPEAGRSRSGRVEIESAAWGVGRIIASVPGCRVVCVYLRGQGQKSWSDLPMRGERFDVAVECIEPKSDQRGARRSREFARQVVTQLKEMEDRVQVGR